MGLVQNILGQFKWRYNYRKNKMTKLNLTLLAACFITSAVLPSAQAATLIYENARLDLEALPLFQLQSSYTLPIPIRGGANVEITRTQGGTTYGVEFAPGANGNTALSPFYLQTNNSAFTLKFSQPISDFSVRIGDYGADSPDQLRISAYDQKGNLIDTAQGSLVTRQNDRFGFVSNQLSLSSKQQDFLDAPKISTILMLGGTPNFPHSVYYDNMRVGTVGSTILATSIAKSAELSGLVIDITQDYGPAAATAGTIAAGPCVDPYTCTAKGVAIAAIAGLALYTGKELTDIVNDPPRHDYNLLFVPEPVSLPSSFNLEALGSDADLARRGLEALLLQRGLLNGWLTTLERHAGAVLDGDTVAAARQEEHLEGLIEQISLNAETLRRFASDSIQLWGPQGYETPDPADVAAAQHKLASVGLEPEVRQALLDFGLTGDQVDTLIAETVAVDPADAKPISVFLETFQKAQKDLSNATACSGAGCIIDRSTIDTPLAAFFLEVQAVFTDPEAILEVFLSGKSIGSVASRGLGLGTYSFLVDDLSLFGLSNANASVFLRNNTTGGALVSSVEISSMLPSPVPVPAPILFLGSSIALLVILKRRRDWPSVDKFSASRSRFWFSRKMGKSFM